MSDISWSLWDISWSDISWTMMEHQKISTCYCYLALQGWSASLASSFSWWSQEKHNLWWALWPLSWVFCSLKAKVSTGFSPRRLTHAGYTSQSPNSTGFWQHLTNGKWMIGGWEKERARVFLLSLDLRWCLWQWFCLLHNTKSFLLHQADFLGGR